MQFEMQFVRRGVIERPYNLTLDLSHASGARDALAT